MQRDFSLPKDSWEQIKKIIQGYWLSAEKEDTSRDSVATAATLHPTIVSRNNKFLKFIGLLTDENPPRPTELGIKLAQGLSHGMTELIKEAASEAAKGSVFLSKILDAVRIRKSMPGEHLKSHIALTAGAPKTTKTMHGAKAVVDFLVEGGVLEEEGDNYTLSKVLSRQRDSSTNTSLKGMPAEKERALKKEIAPGVQLQINLTARDIREPDMASAIQKFLEELKKTAEGKETTPKED